MGRFTVISNKTLSSKLEYLHFSFAAWPENQENALTHTHTSPQSELKVKKVQLMSDYPFSTARPPALSAVIANY